MNFIGAHLGLKNTLDRVKEEMDAAAKTAQAEARSKSKSSGTKPVTKPEIAKPAETPKPAPPPPPEPPRVASLFDGPSPAAASTVDMDDDQEEILAEAAERDEFGAENQEEDAA